MDTMLKLIEELRKLASDPAEHPGDNLEAALDDLADRISEEHKRLLEQVKTADAERQAAVDAAAHMRGCLEDIVKMTLPGEREWLKPDDVIDAAHRKAVEQLRTEAGKDLRASVREIERIVAEYEDKFRVSHWGSDSLSKRIHAVIEHYVRQAANAVSAEKNSRDNTITWLRAMGLVVDMAGNAGTHQEKNARLRGVAEAVESAITHLQNVRVDFYNSYWRDHEDIFKTDYPVREYIHRIHELEDQVKQLQQQNGHEVETQ